MQHLYKFLHTHTQKMKQRAVDESRYCYRIYLFLPLLLLLPVMCTEINFTMSLFFYHRPDSRAFIVHNFPHTFWKQSIFVELSSCWEDDGWDSDVSTCLITGYYDHQEDTQELLQQALRKNKRETCHWHALIFILIHLTFSDL